MRESIVLLKNNQITIVSDHNLNKYNELPQNLECLVEGD